MEGVTFGLRQIADAIQKLSPMDMSHVIMSGGGSASPLWRQMVSDIFMLPVQTLAGAEEGGAYGAGLVGGVGIGVWKDLAEACSSLRKTTLEEPNLANKGVYEEMFGIYNDMYKTLKPIYDRLANV
jgi:xylulokinase